MRSDCGFCMELTSCPIILVNHVCGLSCEATAWLSPLFDCCVLIYLLQLLRRDCVLFPLIVFFKKLRCYETAWSTWDTRGGFEDLDRFLTSLAIWNRLQLSFGVQGRRKFNGSHSDPMCYTPSFNSSNCDPVLEPAKNTCWCNGTKNDIFYYNFVFIGNQRRHQGAMLECKICFLPQKSFKNKADDSCKNLSFVIDKGWTSGHISAAAFTAIVIGYIASMVIIVIITKIIVFRRGRPFQRSLTSLPAPLLSNENRAHSTE